MAIVALAYQGVDIPLEEKPLDFKWMYNTLTDSGYNAGKEGSRSLITARL
jgi:hypothetical protein